MFVRNFLFRMHCWLLRYTDHRETLSAPWLIPWSWTEPWVMCLQVSPFVQMSIAFLQQNWDFLSCSWHRLLHLFQNCIPQNWLIFCKWELNRAHLKQPSTYMVIVHFSGLSILCGDTLEWKIEMCFCSHASSETWEEHWLGCL